MHFIDEAKIYVKAGDGGAGCLSFLRAANLPKGGPDGGNGGNGGSVVVEADPHLNTLVDYRFQQHFKAQKGEHGKGRNRNGKQGEDLVLSLPVGTQIFMEDQAICLADIADKATRTTLIEGGRGGIGNAAFKSSTNQAPRKTTPGEEAEGMWVWLKLKLLSDAGLVGLPNAGKSSFVRAVSRATPKVADYPFTTLVPQLGVVRQDGAEFVVADIPGLIEGASQGTGLGHRFLKHVERCGVLLHLIDCTSNNVAEDYNTIRAELEAYSPELANKTELVALSKTDLLNDEELLEDQRVQLQAACKKEVHLLSSATHNNLTPIIRALYKEIQRFHGRLEEEA